MPKRMCEFDDDLAPQSKIHVGQREVDNGVEKETHMKKVYDRTLDLLMTGARELSQKMNKSIDLDLTDPVPSVIVPAAKSTPQQNFKQMFLNNKLQLETKGECAKTVPIGICGCCRVIDDYGSHNCYYCEKVLCSSCLAQCVKCLESFCQNCSIIAYDTREYNICLNCYQ
ncbi:apoptosis regulatory protein Siva isoform X1 [Neodiprion lecontei]|uniref:Apoptosis regulatory protein Siva isoform X1 n=1 Tax=Neodiprion lecontei TaxID=441921 RepID=A0A6J0C0I9_NEOLC|nr:apoptosis regulatory protein Siva isoform X1 [Neodiprion lecontei]